MNTLQSKHGSDVTPAIVSAQVYHGATVQAITAFACTVTDILYGTVLDVFSVPAGQTHHHVFPQGVQAPGRVAISRSNAGTGQMTLYTAPL